MKPVGVVKYSEFYRTQPPADSFSFLRQYPTDLIILRLSKINHFLFHEVNNEQEGQHLIFKDCFQNLPWNILNKISAEFAIESKEGRVAFFTGPAILKLINLSLLNYQPLPDEDKPASLVLFETNLFNSILICNELYYEDTAVTADLNTHDWIWRLQMMQQSNIRDHIELLFLGPIRNFLFHKFMIKEFPDGRKYLKEFQSNLGLRGYFEYNLLFQSFVFQVIQEYKKSKSPKHIIHPSDTQRKILQMFALKPDDLQNGKYEGKTHGELIPHPLYSSEDSLIILDLYFFNYIVDDALIYNVYRHSSISTLPQFKTFSDFKGTLGRSFYEQFILKEILEKIYRGKNYLKIDSQHDTSLPDFAIMRNQRDVLLIEVKSSALNYKVMQEWNVGEFKKFLDDNFNQKKIDSKSKNKGVYQLARHVANLADSNQFDALLKYTTRKEKTVIYPVIIYLENAMDMAGVNDYLNTRFQEAVSPYVNKFRKIYPLTSINISFFLRYYQHLKKQPAFLFELINDYWKGVNAIKKEFDLRRHPTSFFNYNMSFDQYVSKKLRGDDPRKNFPVIVKDLNLAEK